MNPAENYILNKPEPYRSMLIHLKSIIEHVMPEADLKYKWKVPFYYVDSYPICYLNQTKDYVDVGFSKAFSFEKYKDCLVVDNRKIIRSLRYRKLDEINHAILIEILQQAYKNRMVKFWK